MTEITKKIIPNHVLSWLTGISAPLLIIALTLLWTMGNTMSANAAKCGISHEVNKTRIDHIERATMDIKSSVYQISEAVAKLQVSQSTHNAMIELKIETIKKDIEALRKELPENKN